MLRKPSEATPLPKLYAPSLRYPATSLGPERWFRPGGPGSASPATYDGLVDEGLDFYKNDKNAETLDRFQQALKLCQTLPIKPGDFRAQYGLALVYYTTGRYSESAALCELLVKRGDDKIPNLYVTYGTALDRQHKSAEAVQVYQQAIQKFPQDEPLRRY
ncbi:MAG: tetratricopeptide repeat protein [Janthinobacterium lividum]